MQEGLGLLECTATQEEVIGEPIKEAKFSLRKN